MTALDLPARPWVVGHRGVRGGAVPENTVASVLEAVAQKADMVELDLQLTSDKRLVVHHDPLLPISEEESKPVGELTVEQVKRCRTVWKKSGEVRPYEVPTLDEVLAAAPADLPLNLEIKEYGFGDEPGVFVGALATAIAGREQILISSFEPSVLTEVTKGLPDLPLAPLGGLGSKWQEIVELARDLEAFSIHLHHLVAWRLDRDGLLEKPQAKERPILAYTVNSASEARRLLRSGLAGVITDRPGELRARLEEGE